MLRSSYYKDQVLIRATERDRTADLRITNALLYQLSYSGLVIVIKNTVILSFEEKGIR